MRFTVTMKDPDTLSDAVRDAVKESLLKLPITQDERDILAETRVETEYGKCRKWFRYGEYLEVEVDTDLMTCTVKANP